MKEFNIKEQESYTLDEVKEIIAQHTAYTRVDEITKELDAVKGELLPFKQEQKNKKIKELLPKDFKEGETTFNDFMKIAEISDEDDTDAIKSKIKSTIESRDYFLNAKKETQEIPPEKGDDIVVEKDVKKRQFVY